jgi:hypothetical protein
MEPYALDLFSGENLPAFIWGVGIFVAISAVGTLGFFVLGRRDFLTWLNLIVCVAVGGLIGWGVAKDTVAANTNDARIANLIEQTSDIYGVELTEEQAEDLRPPVGQPLSSYEEFGSTTIEFMDGVIPVVLVWGEGNLFYAVQDTPNSLPTLEQMAEQEEQPTETPLPEDSVPADSVPEETPAP